MKAQELRSKSVSELMMELHSLLREKFNLNMQKGTGQLARPDQVRKVRKDIAAIKALMPKVYHDVASRALQIHGSLGASNEMPFAEQVIDSFHMGLADGPTEVHKVTVARQVLREYSPSDDLFPTRHIPKLREQALAKLGEAFEHEVGNE